MTVPSAFNHTIQQTQEWLKTLIETGGLPDERSAYAVLRATLQQLRDRLTVEEATDLGAQLPLLVRGIFYEGRDPAGKPEKMDRDAFMAGVGKKLPDHPEVDAEQGVRAVFHLLTEKVSAGEIEDVKTMLPKHFQDLCPEAA